MAGSALDSPKIIVRRAGNGSTWMSSLTFDQLAAMSLAMSQGLLRKKGQRIGRVERPEKRRVDTSLRSLATSMVLLGILVYPGFNTEWARRVALKESKRL